MTLSYEQAFQRLEQIVEKLSVSQVALSEMLALYEEAEKLLQFCSSSLLDAEQKIEQLVKQRNGQLSVDGKNRPMTQPFASLQ